MKKIILIYIIGFVSIFLLTFIYGSLSACSCELQINSSDSKNKKVVGWNGHTPRDNTTSEYLRRSEKRISEETEPFR